jgi:hypothetical protein
MSAKKKSLETGIKKMNKDRFESNERIFRTAYKVAKMNRPFTDLPVDSEIQELNGLDMSRVLHSKFSCTNIIDHIAKEMRKKIVQHLLDKKKISVLVEKSTTISNKPILVLCLRCAMSCNSPVQTSFWDLIELPAATAASIQEAILTNLDSHGLTEKYLRDNFIGFACDEASVMLGRKNGVAVGLQKIFPNLIIWHCANHRQELAVHDTRNEVQGVSSVHLFFDRLYSIYSMSPKKSVATQSVCMDFRPKAL